MEIDLRIRPGLHGERTETASESTLARTYGSGGLAVYATPAMIALMEGAAVDAVAPYLAAGCSTVGSDLRVKHLSPTAPGALVKAQARLEAVDGRRLCFAVEAWACGVKIGEGTHERYIIDNERFLSKLKRRA